MCCSSLVVVAICFVVLSKVVFVVVGDFRLVGGIFETLADGRRVRVVFGRSFGRVVRLGVELFVWILVGRFVMNLVGRFVVSLVVRFLVNLVESFVVILVGGLVLILVALFVMILVGRFVVILVVNDFFGDVLVLERVVVDDFRDIVDDFFSFDGVLGFVVRKRTVVDEVEKVVEVFFSFLFEVVNKRCFEVVFGDEVEELLRVVVLSCFSSELVVVKIALSDFSEAGSSDV